MIYSEKCVDERAGFQYLEDGTMKPNKIGREVYELKELEHKFKW